VDLSLDNPAEAARKCLKDVILLQSMAVLEKVRNSVNKFWKIRDGVARSKSTVTQTQT
jgi:hypothetical protein